MKEPSSTPVAERCDVRPSATHYEAPATRRSCIATEGSFCGSVIDDETTSNEVHANDHTVQSYNFDDGTGRFDYSSTDEWD